MPFTEKPSLAIYICIWGDITTKQWGEISKQTYIIDISINLSLITIQFKDTHLVYAWTI